MEAERGPVSPRKMESALVLLVPSASRSLFPQNDAHLGSPSRLLVRSGVQGTIMGPRGDDYSETVPDSLPAITKCPPTRRVPPRAQSLSSVHLA